LSINIRILFAVLEILTQVFIKAGRNILTALRVVLGTINSHHTTIIPTLISPAGRHIATVNQFGSKRLTIVMSFQDATQPLRITIPVMINRKHGTVFEFKTDASTGCHGAFS
jgi:hypothetical protein